MSIMVPLPMTAPMLITAPIMMTALSPISTCSRMMAPGSMRALIFLRSNMGMALLRRSLSMTISSMLSTWSARMGPSSRQSPKTTLLVPSPKTWAEP